MERLSGEYNRGFTAGIMAVMKVFSYIQSDLKHHNKKLTVKLMDELFQCCLDSRERLRESVNGFIRWNGKLLKFEFYEPTEWLKTAQNEKKEKNDERKN